MLQEKKGIGMWRKPASDRRVVRECVRVRTYTTSEYTGVFTDVLVHLRTPHVRINRIMQNHGCRTYCSHEASVETCRKSDIRAVRFNTSMPYCKLLVTYGRPSIAQICTPQHTTYGT